MAENTADIAVSWIRGLQARGVTLAVRNGRVWLRPANAYRDLTDAELITLRHHRAEIKALVSCGRFAVPVVVPQVKAPEPNAPPPAPPCTYCGGRPCVGQGHIAYRTLHASDPEEVARRTQEATAEMHESLRRERRGIPSGLAAAFPLSDLTRSTP